MREKQAKGEYTALQILHTVTSGEADMTWIAEAAAKAAGGSDAKKK